MAEDILDHVRELPERLETQAQDFIQYLGSKVGSAKSSTENEAWTAFSLSQALRGMESDDSAYLTQDLAIMGTTPLTDPIGYLERSRAG